MSTNDSRTPAAKPKDGYKDPLLVTINLREELEPEELAEFLRNADENHREPVEHFKAITIGSWQPHHPKAA